MTTTPIATTPPSPREPRRARTNAGAERILAGLNARTRRTRVTWQASDELSIEEWKAAGPQLGLQSRASAWWLGDWVRFGAKHYGLTVAHAAQLTRYDEQTLYNIASIAAKYPVYRRRETLSFSHHADLAPLSPEEQDTWLDRATDEHLSVQDLRKALRRAPRSQPSVSNRSEARRPITLVCPHCDETLLFS